MSTVTTVEAEVAYTLRELAQILWELAEKLESNAAAAAEQEERL